MSVLFAPARNPTAPADHSTLSQALEATLTSSSRDESFSMTSSAVGSFASSNMFNYYKYNKPAGVACTFDPNDLSSMHHALAGVLQKDARMWPVGRLDKDSTGLVLLSDDGRLAEALQDPNAKQEKEYLVTLTSDISDEDVEQLGAGVMITTPLQRGSVRMRSLMLRGCSDPAHVVAWRCCLRLAPRC